MKIDTFVGIAKSAELINDQVQSSILISSTTN